MAAPRSSHLSAPNLDIRGNDVNEMLTDHLGHAHEGSRLPGLPLLFSGLRNLTECATQLSLRRWLRVEVCDYYLDTAIHLPAFRGIVSRDRSQLAEAANGNYSR